MTSLFLVLGDTLTIPKTSHDVYFFAETTDLTRHYKYHKHKIMFFLASMRSYADNLRKQGKNVYYTNITEQKTYKEALQEVVKKQGVTKITVYKPKDKFFTTPEEVAKNKGIPYQEIHNSNFLTSQQQFKDFLNKNSYQHDAFYRWQRKRLNILLTKKGKPAHGKWSFDKENRKKLQNTEKIPSPPTIKHTEHIKDLKKVVEKLFPDHPGETENFWLPTTKKQAKQWYGSFLEEKFDDFGPYQDAINKDTTFAYHSVISPMLNNGLLSPQYVTEKALERYKEENIHYPSVEGFIRQVIGWREFMKGSYDNKELQQNKLNNQNKLNTKWYTGETGIIPVDDAIKQVQRYGYQHHIQRLMIMSNIFLLCEIHPDDVYKWFMELFVDSADWVMQPNVYDMGQYATKEGFATKPYISSSNYILKMSDYKKASWCGEVDALYWTFLHRKREHLQNNPRMRLMYSLLDKKGEETIEEYLDTAKKVKQRLTV